MIVHEFNVPKAWQLNVNMMGLPIGKRGVSIPLGRFKADQVSQWILPWVGVNLPGDFVKWESSYLFWY